MCSDCLFRRNQPPLLFFLSIALVAFNLGSACVSTPTDPLIDGNVGVLPDQFPDLRVQGEPNDFFDIPVDVVFNSSGQAHLRGRVAGIDDVDVYALGPFIAGDRLIIDVGTSGGTLDAAIALFDEAGLVAYENDDRNFDLGQFDPFLNAVIHYDSSVYFLAISSAPGAPSSGSYEISISRVLGGSAPSPSPQIVALDFNGGSIDIRGRIHTVGLFDTGEISPDYVGMTAAVRRKIAEVVRENFEGLALDLRIIPGDPIPSGCTVSTVFFGGTDPGSFATSQAVDSYNNNQCDQSIIFTNMFTPERFDRVLTADELGIAIGNVVAHEVGHLLGLNHVADINDLMDTTGGPQTFIVDQEFKTSPLDSSIFPIGSQDGMLLLLEVLGLAM